MLFLDNTARQKRAFYFWLVTARLGHKWSQIPFALEHKFPKRTLTDNNANISCNTPSSQHSKTWPHPVAHWNFLPGSAGPCIFTFQTERMLTLALHCAVCGSACCFTRILHKSVNIKRNCQNTGRWCINLVNPTVCGRKQASSLVYLSASCTVKLKSFSTAKYIILLVTQPTSFEHSEILRDYFLSHLL